jgi:NADP-dependent aldehyde dehydrogenase
MALQAVLIDGKWRPAQANGAFRAENPATKSPLSEEYPISSWDDCDAALTAAHAAAAALRSMPVEAIAQFLDLFADAIEQHRESLVEMAHAESALPKAPRLGEVELPRTTNQLRQAAAAAREGSWCSPIIDTKNNIRAYFAPLGPVAVFGPNNFPFAFNSVAGGDFAAAIAAGNPVIAKANTSHPGTTRLLAELAYQSSQQAGLPAATVQLLYRTNHQDGERLVSDARLGAIAYTGSRSAGLKLKAAADAVGKPIYLELSSVNPVVILPGMLAERFEEMVTQFVGSCLMGTGQFCTNPGMVLLVNNANTARFIQTVAEKFSAAPIGTLLSQGVRTNLQRGIETLIAAGAKVLTAETTTDPNRYCHSNTLLSVSGLDFISNPHALQTEAFGNASLFVVCEDVPELCAVLDRLEGNLTGCVYSATSGEDATYEQVAFHLRPKVGRLLNDKMPTGVAVSAAMNHGGPFPATGHPGFTAVGIPTAIHRFGMLQSFDNVRPARLPAILQDKNPGNRAWRCIDGEWTKRDLV